MSRPSSSVDSLTEATRSRAKFSGHGNAKGAAGYRPEGSNESPEFLSAAGQTAIVNPQAGGFGPITIGAAWDMMEVSVKQNLLDKALGRTRKTHKNVDLDLGCFYELTDGTRGALQAFGRLHGSFDAPPYLKLSRDEREGDEIGF
ncbi:MAG: Tellurium resistance protein TerA, partial [Alphaproteobacteria bacterium]|nr:Tellurium resistance protein TerA [Alphaproteobacteria bacterium]